METKNRANSEEEKIVHTIIRNNAERFSTNRFRTELKSFIDKKIENFFDANARERLPANSLKLKGKKKPEKAGVQPIERLNQLRKKLTQ